MAKDKVSKCQKFEASLNRVNVGEFTKSTETTISEFYNKVVQCYSSHFSISVVGKMVVMSTRLSEYGFILDGYADENVPVKQLFLQAMNEINDKCDPRICAFNFIENSLAMEHAIYIDKLINIKNDTLCYLITF